MNQRFISILCMGLIMHIFVNIVLLVPLYLTSLIGMEKNEDLEVYYASRSAFFTTGFIVLNFIAFTSTIWHLRDNGFLKSPK